jgi:hypothetical protein
MSDEHDEAVQAVAADIGCYLKRHPDAADTAEGIARWWLGGRYYENELQLVQEAIAVLVKRGLMQWQTLPGGAEIYRAGRTPVASDESGRRES